MEKKQNKTKQQKQNNSTPHRKRKGKEKNFTLLSTSSAEAAVWGVVNLN